MTAALSSGYEIHEVGQSSFNLNCDQVHEVTTTSEEASSERWRSCRFRCPVPKARFRDTGGRVLSRQTISEIGGWYLQRIANSERIACSSQDTVRKQRCDTLLFRTFYTNRSRYIDLIELILHEISLANCDLVYVSKLPSGGWIWLVCISAGKVVLCPHGGGPRLRSAEQFSGKVQPSMLSRLVPPSSGMVRRCPRSKHLIAVRILPGKPDV